MNYTRKRALLACDFCRHRKRRCDGERPCSTCKESNADCRYKDLPTERVEYPASSNEAVVERLGRIEALLEEQNQQLHHLFTRGTSPSSLEGSPTSTSPKVYVDATAAGTGSSDAADTPLLAPRGSGGSSRSSHLAPRSPFHLAPELPPLSAASLGGLTAAGTPTTSPPPLIASPVGLYPLLGASTSNPVHPHLVYDHHQQQQQHQQQQPFLHPHAPIPYHGTSAGSTAVPVPVFGFSTGPSPFHPGSGLPPGGSRSSLLTTSKASSVANSDVPPQNATEQDQFLIPYEHSTAANTLLSLNLVRYFLEHRHKTQGNKKHSRQETGSQKARGSGRGGLSSMTPNSTVSHSFAYPRTYFFDIETKQPLPPQLDLIYGPGLSPAILPSSVLATSRPATLDGLAQNYFALVHPSAPLFSTAQFRQWSVRVCDPDADEKIETAMCLVVWALGSLAAPPLVSADKPPSLSPTSLHSAAQEQQQPAELDRFALSLFQPALKIIIHHALWEFGAASLTICQALLLAASYFSHIGRPLHSARMVLLASRLMLRLIEEKQRRDAGLDGTLLSVFWVCFIWESDRAAELDIARSGIEPLADHMPLPTSLDPDDGDNMICFIAEIAARRLSNRIHSSLYATEGNDFGQGLFGMISDTDSSVSGRTTPGHKRKRADSDMPFEANVQAGSAGAGLGAGLGAGAISAQPDNSGIGKMLPISAELNRQLEAWYEAMPDNIRPPLLAGNRTGEVRARAFDLGSSDLAENDPQWHDMQQPQHTIHTLNERVQILRIHYYAARHIIHRPFVLGVAWQQQQHQQQQQQLSGRESVESSGHVSPPALPPFFSADALEKCVVCVDSCVSYLTHVLPLLERRSPYLWSFCQSSMACLLVLLVADSCPSIASRSTRMVAPPLGAARSVNIGLLRDQVAARLRLWATPGSSFDAELRIVESLPVELGYGRNDAWKSAKQERG